MALGRHPRGSGEHSSKTRLKRGLGFVLGIWPFCPKYWVIFTWDESLTAPGAKAVLGILTYVTRL